MKKSNYHPIQLIVKHSKDCWMLNGLNGDSPWGDVEYVTDWCCPLPSRVGRDLSGRRNPRARHSWIVFKCNDFDCPAKLAIHQEYFDKVLKLNSNQWKEKIDG